MFKHRINKFIDDTSLFGLKDKVLVALSGGADSIALLNVLVSLGYQCECAHCNFHLRGEESNRDERFVRDVCDKLDVVLHVKHFDTQTYATTKGISIEMAARELRYDWFEDLRKSCGAGVIAVAHHRDDSVETFLLNLIRGTGINGLKGISPKNGYIVRPLLQESRKSIEDYLKATGQAYITDSTNLQDEYVRNKIRLNILPLMKEINPSVAESIFETSKRLTEVADIYNRERQGTVSEKLMKVSESFYRLSISDLKKDMAPLSLLHEVLTPLGFNAAQKTDIWNCLKKEQSGKRFFSSGWEVLRDRDFLLIQRRGEEESIPELSIVELEGNSDFPFIKDKRVAYLDAEKIVSPLIVRKWMKGDKFVPYGMKGKKKVSDYMTDRKFSLLDKEKQLVVCCGDDIVWLVNERSDNRYRVTETTQKILMLKLKDKSERLPK